jgi:sterol desaturase/sphingolipid hydroxylase (fatty acid hydroxylase superfamily)
MHRWMHLNRYLYRTIHSVHHQLTVPYAFGALYNHPIEGFLMDTLGGAIPSLILNMHPWTSTIFYCIATLKTVDDHCGYAWPMSPFKIFNGFFGLLGAGGNGAEFHDLHHWGKGRMYNFSQPFYSFWDVWMGTEYYAAMERKEKVKKEREEREASEQDAFVEKGSRNGGEVKEVLEMDISSVRNRNRKQRSKLRRSKSKDSTASSSFSSSFSAPSTSPSRGKNTLSVGRLGKIARAV